MNKFRSENTLAKSAKNIPRFRFVELSLSKYRSRFRSQIDLSL